MTARRRITIAIALVSGLLAVACARMDFTSYLGTDEPDGAKDAVTHIVVRPPSVDAVSNQWLSFTAYAVRASGAEEELTSGVTWSTTLAPADVSDKGSGSYQVAYGIPTASGTVTATYGTLSAASTVQLRGDICVSGTSGDDSTGDGSAGKPYLTIDNAILKAVPPAGVTLKVLVAGGSYEVSSITMKDRVSILGGFSADFKTRNIVTYPTSILGRGMSGGTLTVPLATVVVPGSVTSATDLDGVNVVGSDEASPSLNCTAAVRVDGGYLRIVRCVLTGGGGTAGSYGAFIANGAGATNLIGVTLDGGGGAGGTTALKAVVNKGHLALVNSKLRGGAGGTARVAADLGGSNPIRVYNCVVTFPGAGSSGIAQAFLLDGAKDALTANNTIGFPDALSIASYGFFLKNSSTPEIYNNLILLPAPSAADRYGVYEADAVTPKFVKNNLFYRCKAAYRDADTLSDWDLAAMEANMPAGTATGNLKDIAPTLDTDYALTLSTPPSIASGGLNGAFYGWSNFPQHDGYPADHNNGHRAQSGPEAWSMGAFIKK